MTLWSSTGAEVFLVGELALFALIISSRVSSFEGDDFLTLFLSLSISFLTFLLDREDVLSLIATVWRPVFLLVLLARGTALLLTASWLRDFTGTLMSSRVVGFVCDELFFLLSATWLDSVVFPWIFFVEEDLPIYFLVSLTLEMLWAGRLLLCESGLFSLERSRLATVVAFFSAVLRNWLKGILSCFFLSIEQEALFSVFFLSSDFYEGCKDENLDVFTSLEILAVVKRMLAFSLAFLKARLFFAIAWTAIT